ncbi:hypothetical protein [Roseateles sp.]|uniref:trypsin-like serine peptidase n=1 Tax=Roseateles sp. TaxID=1971397 RepID=UPI0031CEA29F
MNNRIKRVVIAISTAATAAGAAAVGINEQRFEALGGRIEDPVSSMATVQARLAAESERPRFQSVGKLSFAGSDRVCTATWLGDDEAHSFVMTAAHCVTTGYRRGPWLRHVGQVSLSHDALMARGRAIAFIPPAHLVSPGGRGLNDASDSDTDVAVLRLPRRATPVGAAAEPPLLDDGADDPSTDADPSRTRIEFVGYGAWHVGTRSIENSGRLWASTEGRPTGSARQRIGFDYEPTGETPRWFSLTSGDSGGAFWQSRWGYWLVVGTASARDARWRGSDGPRTAPLVDWLKGVFPGARTLSDRLSVGVGAPFVSRNHAEDLQTGSVAYLVPEQASARGPAAITSTGAAGYSVLHAIVEDELTRHRVEVRLRGQRENGCGGVSRMEDDAGCGGGRSARLTVSFHAEDNPDLPRGSYVGGLEIEAVGTRDGRYRQRVPLRLRIEHLQRGEVTVTRGYESPDLLPGAASRDGAPVRLSLPAQPLARDDGAAFSVGGRFTRVIVTVRDAIQQQDRTLVLRAFRRSAVAGNCPTTAIDAITDCNGHLLAGVNLRFVEEDNPDLRPGLYRGRVFLEARGGRHGARGERIGVQVNIDTL